ncbi:Rha family transcriptional regulator [Fructilactobacillus sp. Tb1]|uniref:Rha family transcriptional regulator n=1 Tax=Fructilactobacillus sp. Tb1 TaxID=3422304 RepID=UPI003D2BE4D5
MNELVVMKDQQAVTSSLQVAETSEKEHRNVSRDINNLKKDVLNFEQMFQETNIPDSYGRDRKAYLMNRDGFTVLAMGFTGKRAMKFKLKYIEAFNAMEKQIKSHSQLAKLDETNQMKKERLAVMKENAKSRQVALLYKGAEMTSSVSAKEMAVAKAIEIITGEHIVPIMQEKYYSATEVGDKLDITANKVGRIANSLDLKAEQPGQNKYGHWVSNKSQYSNKEVSQWLYTEVAIKKIEGAM